MAQAPTVIAAGTAVSGRLEGAEDVEIYGRVQGSIQLDGALYVDAEARVDAEVSVTSLSVFGILVGNITASDTVELHPSARVVGDVAAPRVIVHEGALFRGLLDMGDAPEAAPQPGRTAPRPAPPRSGTAPASRPAPRPAPAPVSRPATAPAPRPAPRAAEPARAPEPQPEPEPAEVEVEVDEDEPDLPEAAGKKKVQVKKRK